MPTLPRNTAGFTAPVSRGTSGAVTPKDRIGHPSLPTDATGQKTRSPGALQKSLLLSGLGVPFLREKHWPKS